MPSIKGTASIASNAAQNKLLRATKFPSSFAKEVDLTKVNSAVMSQWIENKVEDILGFEDEIVASMANNLFFPKVNDDSAGSVSISRNPDAGASIKYSKVDPRRVQLDLAGFLGDDEAAKFTTEVWEMFLDAQTQPKGIPKSLIEQKKAELGANVASTPSERGILNALPHEASLRSKQARMAMSHQSYPQQYRPPQRRQPRDFDQHYRPPPQRDWGCPRPTASISPPHGGKNSNNKDGKNLGRRRRGYSRSRSRSRDRSFHRLSDRSHDRDRNRDRDRYMNYSDGSSEDSYGRRRRDIPRYHRHERKNRSHPVHRRSRSRSPRSWSPSRSRSRSISRSRSSERLKGRYRKYNDSDNDCDYRSKRRNRSRSISRSHSRSPSRSRSASSCANIRWRRRRTSCSRSSSVGHSRHRDWEKSHQKSRVKEGSKRSRSSDRSFRRNRSESLSPSRSGRKRDGLGKGRSRSHSYS